MLWSDKITCHSGSLHVPGTAGDVWRPPEDSIDGDGYPRITPWRTCSYCGSIHPGDLFALTQRIKFLDHATVEVLCAQHITGINAANSFPSMELADMKYGQPHKIYVSTREVLHPEKEFRCGTNYDKTPIMKKGHEPWVKFYIDHLQDEGVDDEAFSALTSELARCTRVKLTRDAEGVKWQIPKRDRIGCNSSS